MEEWGPWTEVAQHQGEYVRGGVHQGGVVSPQHQAGCLYWLYFVVFLGLPGPCPPPEQHTGPNCSDRQRDLHLAIINIKININTIQ